MDGAIPVGRVYVDDPDDWDSVDKTYKWVKRHPLFNLNSSTGEVTMLPGGEQTRLVGN